MRHAALSGRARDRYANVSIVSVSVPVDILAKRIEARGRESQAEIERRLERADMKVPRGDDVVSIANSGTIEQGARLLADAVLATKLH